MKSLLMTCLLVLLVVPMLATAQPVTGIFNSTDLGGQLLTGRASTWRSGINSGLPHVLHVQSWDGTTLGAQWEISCAIETTPFDVVDNRVNGVGTIVYTSHFEGGDFTFFAGGWPWGDGTGTLGSTTLITTVQYIMINGVSTGVAAVVNGNTSGQFDDGCALNFAIGNGSGVGETTSLDPSIMLPAYYPVFLDGTCNQAAAGSEFGTWGTVSTITISIDCSVGNEAETWGGVKAVYR